MEVILLTIALVGFSFLAIGINIFFVKGRDFPETEVGKNKTMQSMGIGCVKCDELKKYNDAKRRLAANVINPSKLKLDITALSNRRANE